MDMTGAAGMDQTGHAGGYMNRWYDSCGATDGTGGGGGGGGAGAIHQDYYNMVHCAYGNNMGELRLG